MEALKSAERLRDDPKRPETRRSDLEWPPKRGAVRLTENRSGSISWPKTQPPTMDALSQDNGQRRLETTNNQDDEAQFKEKIRLLIRSKRYPNRARTYSLALVGSGMLLLLGVASADHVFSERIGPALSAPMAQPKPPEEGTETLLAFTLMEQPDHSTPPAIGPTPDNALRVAGLAPEKRPEPQTASAPQPVAPQPVAPQPVAPQPVAPQAVTPQPVPPQAAVFVLEKSPGKTASSGEKPRSGARDRRTTVPVESRLNQAAQAFQQGDLNEAERLFRTVLQIDPHSHAAMIGVASVNLRRGRTEKARFWYQRVLREDPNNSLAATALLGLNGSGDAAAEESRLKSLLQTHPDASHLHFALGNMYATEHRWALASGAYADANLLSQEKNPEVLLNLAASLDHLHRWPDALVYYNKALAIAEREPWMQVDFDREAVRRRVESLQRPGSEPK